MINNALQLPLGKEYIVQKYQEISQILQLKTILTEREQKSNEIQDLRYSEFITKMGSQKDRNTELLANLLQQCAEKEQLINFEYPNQIKNQFFSFIDEIDFFNQQGMIRNNNPLQPISSNTNQQKLMKLISNKSNYCTNSFLTQLQILFERTKCLLSHISFENMHEQNKQPIDFSGMSDIKLKMIEEYVQHSTSIEQNRENIQNIEKSLEIKELQQIFDSSVNFMNNNIKIQLKEYLIDTYPFLKKVNFSSTFSDREKLDSFRLLTAADIEDLFELIMTRKELTQENKYNLSQTKRIEQLISIGEDQLEDGSLRLQQLFRKYPIFDLLKFKEKQVGINLIKSNYNEGDLRIVINDNFQVSFNQQYNGNNQNVSFTCVSNEILDENIKYVFRFKIQEFKSDLACICLGLVENRICQSILGTLSKLSCGFSDRNGQLIITDHGINKYLKNNGFKFGKDFEIEVRVWLGGKQLEILDFPNYQTQIAVNDNNKDKLNNSNNLRLFLGMCDQSKQLKVTLTRSFKVDSFPN